MAGLPLRVTRGREPKIDFNTFCLRAAKPKSSDTPHTATDNKPTPHTQPTMTTTAAECVEAYLAAHASSPPEAQTTATPPAAGPAPAPQGCDDDARATEPSDDDAAAKAERQRRAPAWASIDSKRGRVVDASRRRRGCHVDIPRGARDFARSRCRDMRE